jgi:hypothetical protein
MKYFDDSIEDYVIPLTTVPTKNDLTHKMYLIAG